MTKIPYTGPKFKASAFNCPYCGAYSDQKWLHLFQITPNGSSFESESKEWYKSQCLHCAKVATWHNDIMIQPEASNAPFAHSDMPSDISVDFEEARSVLQRSPRSSAALLRLCLQKLCKELGEPGININDDIASLVKKGLPIQVQQALDIVRVIGNEQVHPGTLDVRDDPALAQELFELLNFIIEDRITRPKSIAQLYQRLPLEKLKGIQKRDA